MNLERTVKLYKIDKRTYKENKKIRNHEKSQTKVITDVADKIEKYSRPNKQGGGISNLLR